MNLIHRLACAALLVALPALPALQAFPDKPMRFVIPFAAGGGLGRHGARHRRAARRSAWASR